MKRPRRSAATRAGHRGHLSRLGIESLEDRRLLSVAPPGVPAPLDELPDSSSIITGRHVFYDNSKYDSNSPGFSIGDSSAIDTSKIAYLPGAGGNIGPANMTSYSRGINGIMVDLNGVHGTLSLADFEFAMSGQGSLANNTPSSWIAAPAPTMTVLEDTPDVATDRIVFIWPDNAIENRYLEVTVRGNDAAGGFNTNAGMVASDIFYFGNRIGDTFAGQSPALPTFTTTAGDEIEVRGATPAFGLPVTNVMDFDKNGLLLSSDQITSRSSAGFLFKIDIGNPPALPAPPDGDDGSGSAIASSLAVADASPSATTGPAPSASPLETAQSSTAMARVTQLLEERDRLDIQAHSQAADAILDEYAPDEDLLDSLLGE